MKLYWFMHNKNIFTRFLILEDVHTGYKYTMIRFREAKMLNYKKDQFKEKYFWPCMWCASNYCIINTKSWNSYF